MIPENPDLRANAVSRSARTDYQTSDATAMKSGPGPRLLSAQSAANYLGVPYTTLRDWALRGYLPVIRAPQSRRMWFDCKDLDRIIDQWKERLA